MCMHTQTHTHLHTDCTEPISYASTKFTLDMIYIYICLFVWWMTGWIKVEVCTTIVGQDYAHYKWKIIKKILATWLWDIGLDFHLNSNRADIFGTVMSHGRIKPHWKKMILAELGMESASLPSLKSKHHPQTALVRRGSKHNAEKAFSILYQGRVLF